MSHLHKSTHREIGRLWEHDRTLMADILGGKRNGMPSGSATEQALLDIARLFSTADVDLLRGQVAERVAVMSDMTGARVRDLANRIAALLPPSSL